MRTLRTVLLACSLSLSLSPVHNARATPPIEERVTHHYADNNGVRIHYVTLGEGPLIVMLHGFPDYWYTWRHQMDALSEHYTVAAVDLRGYNLSDKPSGDENYDMRVLIGDVAAVIRDAGYENAVICGHDWGGAIAWFFAMYRPDLTERLIICNLPHPRGMTRELSGNAEQHQNSAYARRFQQDGAAESLSSEQLASWVTDESARARYIEAFDRSDFDAMLAYYRRNFPRTSAPTGDSDTGSAPPPPPAPPMPPVKCSVLMFHGLDDQALLASGLNDTWEWVDSDLTIVTVPGAGHFVQQDAADLVTRTMVAWLGR